MANLNFDLNSRKKNDATYDNVDDFYFKFIPSSVFHYLEAFFLKLNVVELC